MNVDHVSDFTGVTLHHEQCRPARWNDTGAVFVPTVELTVLTQLVGLPNPTGGFLAAMIANPGLEMIRLKRLGGDWQVLPHHDLDIAGLDVIKWPHGGAAVAAGAELQFRNGQITITLPGRIAGGATATSRTATATATATARGSRPDRIQAVGRG